MRITIEKEDLLYAVTAVEKAVSNKNTLPVLAGILIKVKDGEVSFRTTDLELAIECKVRATVLEEGTVVAPGRKLSGFVRLLPSGLIEITADTQNMNVAYAGNSVDIPCFPPEDFPLLPRITGEIEGTLPVAAFKRLVRQVSIAAAQDEVRPVFAGIYTEINGDELTMVATDTHRLAKGVGKWNGSGKANLLIPSRVLQEVFRLTGEDDENIRMVVGDNQVFFSFGDLLFTSRLIVGQYPDYRQVIPAENLFCTELTLNKRSFMDTLERAALIARNSGGKTNTAKLLLGDESIHVCAESPDEGKIDEELPARVEGEQIAINYNVKYLQDVLKVLDGDNFTMRLTGMNTPGVITAEEGGEDYLYLLLPVRMSRA